MVRKKAKKVNWIEQYWLLIALVVFVLVFIIVYFLFSGYGKITYKTLTFTKEQTRGLTWYHYAYYFNDSQGQVYKNNVYLREDPRENDIPVYGDIFYTSSTLYLAINKTGISNCSESQIALDTLQFFLNNNLYKVKRGTTSKEDALEKNQTYVTCTSVNNTVVQVEAADTTTITKEPNNCYVVHVAGCEIMPAVEKLIVQSILDAKARH